MIELTRVYRFPAAHVLRHSSLSDAENDRVYGKCANRAGHGHDYGVELTVTGPLDERTGCVVAPDLLDAIFEETVAARFSHRMLNEDDAFAERVPTAENIAIAVHELVAPRLAEQSSAELVRVRVHETRKNTFVYGAME